MVSAIVFSWVVSGDCCARSADGRMTSRIGNMKDIHRILRNSVNSRDLTSFQPKLNMCEIAARFRRTVGPHVLGSHF
jgi:hypothetical protein